MAINTPFNTNAASSGEFNSPGAVARRQTALASAQAAQSGGTAVVAPQSPPPPVVPPVTSPVTGGNAAVSVLGPNQIYDPANGVLNVIPKPTIPGTTPVAPVTGGNAPAQPLNTASMITGTTAQPQSPAPPTGGNGQVQAASPFPTINAPQQVYQENMGAGNVVQDYLSQLLNSNSPYIQNARRNGLELAANRGLLNSSIAAGNSQRAAIDAAQPILNEITQLHNQREQLAFTGEQNQMDRDQQITMARVNDWAANNQFNREYNGQLSLLPITSVTALNNQLMQAAIDNPEIFPPEIVSGLGEFFGTNLLSMLQQWFPNQYGGGNG